jgi:hypothetical protein
MISPSPSSTTETSSGVAWATRRPLGYLAERVEGPGLQSDSRRSIAQRHGSAQ